MLHRNARAVIALFSLILVGCSETPWNDPYSHTDNITNTYYTSFTEQPKTLDPALSYNVNEAVFIAQIYEAPLQYHYLKRPFTIIPQTAVAVPEAQFYDKAMKLLPKGAAQNKIVYSVYKIQIKPGIFYQPHPAFAKTPTGGYFYHHLISADLHDINTLRDFKNTGTRELTAEDYVYQIKRLANPKLASPIYGVMGQHILGWSEFSKLIESKTSEEFIDLRQISFAGAKALDRYTYQIVLNGAYPQFIYWLTMPFFTPMPWEADYFYSQPGMAEKNITLNWYPVGTGPYQLTENDPNRQMILEKNPNYHGELFPNEGEASDQTNGFLQNAGKPLPFIDRVVYVLEKESIPRWNKFFQGYYDQSAIASDNFDEAIQVDTQGNPELTPIMKSRSIRLRQATGISIFYMGFNMLDNVVGGYTDRARKLRQAISIAVDFDEYIAIFLNGRAVPAQGPLPPQIFGYREGQAGIDPLIYRWENRKAQRRSLEEAKKLLEEAGYPNGIDPKTGEPLVLNYDVPATARQDDVSVFAWTVKQFKKLGIELQVRDTQYNRFQEKMRTGNAQIFSWGWTADYPDPENFLFLFYGPNSKVGASGENTANYHRLEFDAMYEKMRNLPNGPERQALIDNMITMLRNDTPWVWGVHPKEFVLSHSWMTPSKPGALIYNTLKYAKLDPALRATMREKWNKPIVWPLGVGILILILILLPVFIAYRRKERMPRK